MPTRARSPFPEPPGLGTAAAYVVTHAWQVFIVDWNWKTAVLSATCRLAVWPASKAAGAMLLTPGAFRGLLIEFLFRLAIGGFWGSLLQVFAEAQPAWLAGLFMVTFLPACAHGLEYFVLRAGGAAHAGALTVVSIIFSVLSILVNWVLMRRGILVTGRGAASFGTDLRRIFGGLSGRRFGWER